MGTFQSVLLSFSKCYGFSKTMVMTAKNRGVWSTSLIFFKGLDGWLKVIQMNEPFRNFTDIIHLHADIDQLDLSDLTLILSYKRYLPFATNINYLDKNWIYLWWQNFSRWTSSNSISINTKLRSHKEAEKRPK